MSVGDLFVPNYYNLFCHNLDISGDLILEGDMVLDDLLIEGTTSSTSTSTGALRVVGGSGIGENLNVGGNISIYSTSKYSFGTAGGGVFSGDVGILSTTQSVGTASGALYVAGGASLRDVVRVGGKIYNYDDVVVYSSTSSASTSTGAITVSGGVGIAENLRVGGALYLPTATGTPTGLTYYEEVNMDILIDLFASTAVHCHFTRVGRLVTFNYETYSASYSSTAINPLSYGTWTDPPVASQMPVRFRPASVFVGYSRMTWKDAGANPYEVDGHFQVLTNGTFLWITYNKVDPQATTSVGALGTTYCWNV